MSPIDFIIKQYEAASGKGGLFGGEIEGKVVRDHPAKSVGLVGWLLECGKNGTFVECHRQLVKASEILWRLAAVE